jgi:hypothetical protein
MCAPGVEHPAYQALLRHAMACLRCGVGARCETAESLLNALRAARGQVGFTWR